MDEVGEQNLHQDEFGPTRAERMQALRDLLYPLEVLSSRLEALPPHLRLLVSEWRTEGRSAAEPIDVDPIASYSSDKDATEVVTVRKILVGASSLRISKWRAESISKCARKTA